MKLNRKQKATLNKHSKHHTKKHMNMMIKEMEDGKSFSSSHIKAQKKIGR
tara:strand:- start:929 stop:1078 length:150 start_codon:yes stop_codon:yes gene_type:complete